MLEVVVVRVENVTNHPTRDSLTINTLSDGAIAVSNRNDNGTPRYVIGDLVVRIPERAIVPEWLLKHQHCWDEAKGKGTCAGSKGNRVKNRNFDGIASEGMLFAGTQDNKYAPDIEPPEGEENDKLYKSGRILVIRNESSDDYFFQGDSVIDFLGITEWEG